MADVFNLNSGKWETEKESKTEKIIKKLKLADVTKNRPVTITADGLIIFEEGLTEEEKILIKKGGMRNPTLCH